MILVCLILAVVGVVGVFFWLGLHDDKKEKQKEKERQVLIQEAQEKLRPILEKGPPYPIGKNGKQPLFVAPVEELVEEHARVARSYAIRGQDEDYFNDDERGSSVEKELRLVTMLKTEQLKSMISNIDGMPYPKREGD